MQLKAYPQYQDSGLPWLGQIPQHWQIGPGMSAFRENKRKNSGLTEKTILSLSYGRVIVKPTEKRGLVPDSFETYQILEPGDIVIRGTDLQNDVTSLRVGLVRDVGIITSAYLGFKTVGDFSGEFGYWLLHAYDLQKVLYGLGSGLRQNLSFTDFKRLPVLIPPRDEQDLIARFLRVQDARFSRLIGVKRAMMALLNEQKSALIHRAVTRGVAGDVELKDSGLPWLGQVPKHWGIAKLSNLTTRIGDGLHGTPEYVDESEFHFVNGNNLSDGKIKIKQSTRCVSRTEFARHHITLTDKSLLMSINGTIGNVAYYDGEKIILGKSAAYINCREPLERSYLFFLLQSPQARAHFQQELTGTTIFNLSLASIRSFPLPVPPLAEQRAIVSYIESETAQINAALGRIGREIELIAEYRTRLVCDVVTGQWDVRDIAATSPDIVEAPALDVDLDEENDENITLED